MRLTRRSALAHFGLLGASAWLSRDALAQTVQDYRYDALGRLRCVTYGDGSRAYYEYDAAGNRTTIARVATGAFTTSIAVSGAAPINLRALANTAGYDGIRNANITFTIASNVTITGAAGAGNGGIAIDTGDWPLPNCSGASITLALQISGKVYGGGGRGARGARPGAATTAGIGGDAIYCRAPITITVNSGGEVRSGGGGAGGGGGWYNGGLEINIGGGGGGGGFPNGTGGAAGGSDGGTAPQAGSAGTTSGGGAAGGGNGAYFGYSGGAGGAGGNAGASGADGVVAPGSAGSGWTRFNATVGGVAGYAIRKNGNTVPVTNNGTVSGTVG